MITDDPHNLLSGFIGHNMVIYDSVGYSGPICITLQSHNTLCDRTVTQKLIKKTMKYKFKCAVQFPVKLIISPQEESV